jgi:hypothetical protein
MKELLKGACAIGAFSCLVFASGAVAASEPINNNYPWMYGTNGVWNGDMSVYASLDSPSSIWNFYEDISPTGDVDYHVMSCGRPYNGGNGTVASVRVDFTHSLGDIDIYVYNTKGTVLGTSQGVGNYEEVNVSSQNLSTVILKVYGYAGAVNNYQLMLNCQ